jgi:hypothetical protein
MLRPAARHQQLQLSNHLVAQNSLDGLSLFVSPKSNHPDPSGGFVREKTRFSILQGHAIWFACSLSGFSKPISCRLIFTNRVSSLPEIAFV